ncbi:M15 family metallopeptidase [Mammaliicoccus stepanovicii]|uniref:D-alanyl-D-alanine carboxypeptidase n=1 Tax=Mammaliicoccus stepanovicii TaxID=643214 RepID=A0A239YS87_9STAP|nr:M15 family metallopeptidase [Mammaliicoccus stepanovicii]PNZ75908.1 hypothetical protein CD111_06105 [Mammaliicoccus stepanovicii]GGI42316.1 D-Ala-D-Ala carboxypeptidase [Mammaliicoccus stepanovicii]SNV61949.1 D-alanyl-D-alanine carboxypeptidase [Mammaliicoccus stepanovicii]
MKRIYTLIAASMFLLSACTTDESNQQKPKKSEETHDSSQKQSDKQEKKQHKVTKKNGVTYIDGHIFANKKVDLPRDYAPGENKIARDHLNQLIQDANKEGLDIVFRSGYRSYEEQAQLYKDYVARDGVEEADKYSAKPGKSEHQTGLTFDVGSNTATYDFKKSFGDTKEGKWIEQNAYKYGFIIRYLKGKENITGYQYEPWHLRYVGKDLAKKIHQKNLTLEEYFEYGY